MAALYPAAHARTWYRLASRHTHGAVLRAEVAAFVDATAFLDAVFAAVRLGSAHAQLSTLELPVLHCDTVVDAAFKLISGKLIHIASLQRVTLVAARSDTADAVWKRLRELPSNSRHRDGSPRKLNCPVVLTETVGDRERQPAAIEIGTRAI